MIGFLRNNTSVSWQKEFVTITAPFVEIDFPRKWVDENPSFREVLRREKSGGSIQNPDRQLADVLHFLKLQSCFYDVPDKDTFSLNEIKTLFKGVMDSWYFSYYSHELWNYLREGSLGKNGFIAWVLQNYHVSRLAGVSDAKCASSVSSHSLNQAFRESALEEYWHCDAFYFVEHPTFSLSKDDVKSYLELPSTLAFVNQMLFMAEKDWLGYSLFSYFQESSIRFHKDCFEFYEQVEAQYGIQDYFRPWAEHIRLDFAHQHAESFALLLESDNKLSRDQAISSIRNSWYAFHFLLKSLDEILAEDFTSEKFFRAPPCRHLRLTNETSCFKTYEKVVCGKLNSRNLLDLIDELDDRLAPIDVLCIGTLWPNSSDEHLCLANILVEASFKALANARTHDEIISLGEMTEIALKFYRSRIQKQEKSSENVGAAETVAFGNFFREVANQPLEFCFFTLVVARIQAMASKTNEVGPWFPFSVAELSRTKDLLKGASLDSTIGDHLVNRYIQMIEQLKIWMSVDKTFFEADLFHQ
ncbi:MAG: hypothetical protein AB7F88_00070 [Pyrinomonadaceae bacterium]